MSKALYYLMVWGDGIQPSISCVTWQSAIGTITTAIVKQANGVGIQWYLHKLNYLVKRGSIKRRFSRQEEKTWGFYWEQCYKKRCLIVKGLQKSFKKLFPIEVYCGAPSLTCPHWFRESKLFPATTGGRPYSFKELWNFCCQTALE